MKVRYVSYARPENFDEPNGDYEKIFGRVGLEGQIRDVLKSLGFELLDNAPVSAPSLFLDYELEMPHRISHDFFEHRAKGGAIFTEFSSEGYIVDVDGPLIKDRETSIYGDGIIMEVGITPILQKELDEKLKQFEKTWTSSDRKVFG